MQTLIVLYCKCISFADAVNVCHRWHHFDRRNVQETNTRFASCCGPTWNETFTFHIEKSTPHVLQCDFGIYLPTSIIMLLQRITVIFWIMIIC